MNKKKKIIILSIAIFIVWCVVCLAVFSIIKKRLDKADYLGFMEECIEYIKNDAQFKEDYGSPINFIEHEDKKIQNKDEGSVNGLFINFYVEVDSGEFYQVTMRTYKETDEWKIDYYEVKKVRQENVKNG